MLELYGANLGPVHNQEFSQTCVTAAGEPDPAHLPVECLLELSHPVLHVHGKWANCVGILGSRITDPEAHHPHTCNGNGDCQASNIGYWQGPPEPYIYTYIMVVEFGF